MFINSYIISPTNPELPLSINQNELLKVRYNLDKLDNKLLQIIKKRTSLVNEVLKLKEYKKEIIDQKRINLIQAFYLT